MMADEENLFHSLLNKIGEDDDLTTREKRQLKQPAYAATPKNIFTWHLNEYTIFEDETGPHEPKQGVLLHRVGVTTEGRLSDAQIARHEARLRVRLPEPWREVYRHFNGGWTSSLRWGERTRPKQNDILAVPSLQSEYLALEDVAPLREHLAASRSDIDTSQVDERLIAIAFCEDGGETFVLDYRSSDNPAVGKFYIDNEEDDPLYYEEEGFWWPNMSIFFRGLYIQDRIL